MSDKEKETFQLRGVLKANEYSRFDFVYSNGLQSNSGCKEPMTEHLIKPDHISRIDISYYGGGEN